VPPPLRGTQRWCLARLDADLRFSSAAESFSFAFDVPLTEHDTPGLNRHLNRSVRDADLSTFATKDDYRRTLLFMVIDQFTCTPEVEHELVRAGSYPSMHAAISRAWALIVANITPDGRDQVLGRERVFGDNRSVCNVHWANGLGHRRPMHELIVNPERASDPHGVRSSADSNQHPAASVPLLH
jgi:acid phosphatase (class A)